MFTIYTRNEKQIFKTKTQARRFYRVCAACTEGAESDSYYDILESMEDSKSSSELVMGDYSGNPRMTLEYDEAEDYLRPIEK